MVNKLPSTKYVTISEALSWLAFGDVRKREALNKELADQAFGIPYKAAKQRLENVLSLFVSAALNGKVKLYGQYLSDLGAGADDEVTEEIPTIKLSDFKQFDITVDGLRFGSGFDQPPLSGPCCLSVQDCLLRNGWQVSIRANRCRQTKSLRQLVSCHQDAM